MANDFFFERKNLRLPNHLARRYIMWFNSKKREHSYQTYAVLTLSRAY